MAKPHHMPMPKPKPKPAPSKPKPKKQDAAPAGSNVGRCSNVRDAGCDWPEDDSRESRLWRFNAHRIVNAAWHQGFADHARAQRIGEEAVRKMFGDDKALRDATLTQEDHND